MNDGMKVVVDKFTDKGELLVIKYSYISNAYFIYVDNVFQESLDGYSKEDMSELKKWERL